MTETKAAKKTSTTVKKTSTSKKTATSKATVNVEVEKLVDNLTLFDDDLMSKVFDENIPATELLLKIILGKKVKVVSVKGQYNMKSPIVGGRSITLDILAIDLVFHEGKNGESYTVGGFNEWKNIDLVQELCKQMDEKLGREVGTSKGAYCIYRR